LLTAVLASMGGPTGDVFPGRLYPARNPRIVMRCWSSCVIVVLVLSSAAWCTRTLKDEAGRNVTVPDQVKRVISLAPSVTDTIYALGAASQLAAITDYTQYPTEAAKEKPSIGDILKPSLERITTLHPDLVIGIATFNSPETIHGLERIGIPVFLLSGRGLAGVYSSVISIGHVLGRDQEAAVLLAQLKAREQKVRAMAEQGKRPSVFLALQLDPCITAGKGAFMTELIGIAGAKSVTADLPQDWLRVSLEAILPRKPQYILLMKSAPFDVADMRARAGWNALDAVKQGRIMRADDRLQVPAPVAFDGLEDLARQVQAAQ
jgi:iron complex transport system substrate-binding protein